MKASVLQFFPELLQRRFRILELRRLDLGEACTAILGLVANDLHLAAERKHVWRKAPADQHGLIDFFRGGVGGSLLEHAGQGVEADFKDRH